MKTITSLDNPKLKEIIRLRKTSRRKKHSQIVIEGKKEISLALKAGIKISSLFISENISDACFPEIADRYVLGSNLFAKISLRENPDGFIAMAMPKTLELSDLKISKNPFLIVLEAVEKPGNLGAILRSADAAGADAVLLLDPTTDICNPNVIRASLGTVFVKPVVICQKNELFEWLKINKIQSYAATPSASKFYYECDFTRPSAIFIGTEHQGLSREALESVSQKIKIPMKGAIDSLNASVSTAIITYEALRQRLFHN